jgi:photosystem II stability/assembly factor-like uncharacterized protein
MTLPIGKSQSYLEQIAIRGCPIPIYVKQADCAPKDVFMNYDRVWVYGFATLTAQNEGDLVSGADADVKLGQEFPSEADFLSRIWECVGTRQDPGASFQQILKDICAIDKDACGGICGPKDVKCNSLYACGASAAGPATHMSAISRDGGVTWTATAVTGITAGLDASACEAVWMDGDTVRILVAQGETSAGAPPVVARSDDYGVTWATANVGTTNALFAPHSQSMFALDSSHIWLGLDSGEIYFSSNGGVTWAEQDTGGNADAIRAIHFADERVGVAVGGNAASTEILYTQDGGEHWAQAADNDPAGAANMANAVVCFDRLNWMVGYETNATGILYQTEDGGVTWMRLYPTFPTNYVSGGQVNSLVAINRLVVWIGLQYVGAAASAWGAIGRTFNGGADWEAYQISALVTAAPGIEGIFACSENEAWGVGGVSTDAQIHHVGI